MTEPNGAETREQTVERIVREHGPRIYNLARRMLGNDADAEDVTQDVLLQVVRKLDTFRGEAALSTWLHRITVNAALNKRQQRAVRRGREVTEPFEHYLEDGHRLRPVKRWSVPPEQPVLNAEQQRLIEEAIAEMPEIYRDVYVLADIENLPNAEIADILGLSVQAVKSRLHRARMWMRDELAPHFEGERT
ncbi:MAG TPA: sigma-70 family RNA polymerase sigma factor [Gemmataceae bacterium]